MGEGRWELGAPSRVGGHTTSRSNGISHWALSIGHLSLGGPWLAGVDKYLAWTGEYGWWFAGR